MVRELDHDASIIRIAQDVIRGEIRGLEALYESLDEAFINAVNAIATCTGKLVVTGVGKSGLIGQRCSAMFNSVCTCSVFLHPTDAVHGDIGVMRTGDILFTISNSGNSVEIIPVIEYAKKRNIQIISLLRNYDSKIAQLSDIVLVLQNIPEISYLRAPTTSSAMMTCYIYAIMTCVHTVKQFSSEDYRQVHPAGTIGKGLMSIKEVMRINIPKVHFDVPLYEAIMEISNKRLGCTCVVDDDNNMVGIITDGDLRRYFAKNHSTNCKAKDIMRKDPVNFNKEMLISEAISEMHHNKITNGFVVEDAKPIGAVHLHDLMP